MSSTKGKIATSASVRGRKSRSDGERGQPAQPPGAAREPRDRFRQRRRIAALEAVRDDERDRAARVRRETRHGEKRLERVADASAPVKVTDDLGRAGERLLAALEPHRARHPREAGAEREHLDPWARLRERMGETQVVFGAGLHRAGDVNEQQHLARPHPALEPRELDELAVVARRVAQGAAQVDDGAAPRAQATIAQPLRQAPRGLPRQAPQRFARVGGAEAALDQALRRGSRPDRIRSNSSALTGSSAPRRSSWTRTTSSSSPSARSGDASPRKWRSNKAW